MLWLVMGAQHCVRVWSAFLLGQFWPEYAGKTITSCAHVLPKHRMIGETKKDQIDNMSMPHHKHSNKF